MKNLLKAFSIIALVAVIGFSMVACGGGGDDGGGGGGKGALISKWYVTQEFADNGDDRGKLYEFKSNGKLIVGNKIISIEVEVNYEATATQVRSTGSAWADYTISGTALTITNAGGSGLTDGTYYKPKK